MRSGQLNEKVRGPALGVQESDAGHSGYGTALKLRLQGNWLHPALRLLGLAETTLGQSLCGSVTLHKSSWIFHILGNKLFQFMKNLWILTQHLIPMTSEDAKHSPKRSSVIINLLTPWLMEPGGSIPHSQGLSNNPYPEPNQPNYLHWYLSRQGSF